MGRGEVLRPAIGGGGGGTGGGITIEHVDAFPVIPGAGTAQWPFEETHIVERNKTLWHAQPGDTKWSLMTTCLTDMTGIPGT